MTGFWVLALALALAGSAFLVVPLLRSFFANQGAESRPGMTVGTGIAVALLLPIAALLLYSHWTTWPWSGQDPSAMAEQPTHSMEEAVATLEARLRENPEDAEGWHMLGRTYMTMRDFEKAAGAFRHVLALTEGGTVNTRADYAESLAMSDPEGLSGEAGTLFRKLVEEAPQQPKVLWYAGLTEFEAGNEDQGREYWGRLLELDPPEQLRQIIVERLAPAPASAAGEAPVAPAGGARTEAGEPVAAAAPETATAEKQADDGGIRLQVTLDPALAGGVPDSAPLFIFARNKGAAGPPLAVIRKSAGDLPLSVSLSDDNAMMAGTRLSDIPELTLVARLALSGSPAAQPGDMFGEVEYSRGAGRRTRIVIDQVVP